jgi:site-specific recombinase XerD
MTPVRLSDLVAQYVALKQSLGQGMRNNAAILKFFCRVMGDIPVTAVTADRVLAFLNGTGPVTLYWHRKHQALNSFYRFAITRNYVTVSPLPTLLPARPASFVPYIYSPQELQRLVDATAGFPNRKNTLSGDGLRVLLLLLYGAGLRISEALSLTVDDIDLSAAILTIRDSKFYKTRLVPVGPRLNQELSRYQAERRPQGHSPQPFFFLSRQGTPLASKLVERAFARLRRYAGVQRPGGADPPPRLHDLRHSFAVHRLVLWYRQGADVQKLLPRLATYLGHVGIDSTQQYLTLTPDLLQEACLRFEHYAFPGSES